MPAYNPYFPATYQNSGYGYNPYAAMQIPQQMMQPVQQGQQATQQASQQPPQMQSISGGIIHVQSENEARQYPVAPGNSVTFIDDTQAFCYTKTMSTSQFDAPVFKKFKLVEVPDNSTAQNAQNTPSQTVSQQGYNFEDFALKADLETLRAEIERIENKFENATPKRAKTVKEADKNEQST